MMKIAVSVTTLAIIFGCSASRKNTYRQYLLKSALKHNDSFIQEVFKEGGVAYFVTGDFIIVKKDMQSSEDTVIHKTPLHTYYIMSTLASKQNAVKVYTDFEAKLQGKDYEIFTKDSIERAFLHKGLITSMELDKYQKASTIEGGDSIRHLFAQKGDNFHNKLAPDSIVLISSPPSDFPFHYLDFKNGQQIKQIEMFQKIEGGQFNSLVMWLTKPANRYHSATMDSILNKYKDKL